MLINDENPKGILGFYTLSIWEVETDYLPPIIVKKISGSSSCFKTGETCCIKKHQHKGYGKYLKGSAIEKVILIAENLGTIGLFIDAKDNHTKKYLNIWMES